MPIIACESARLSAVWDAIVGLRYSTTSTAPLRSHAPLSNARKPAVLGRVELSLRTGASNAADLADLAAGDTVHGTIKKVNYPPTAALSTHT